jgi:hypothetical protein
MQKQNFINSCQNYKQLFNKKIDCIIDHLLNDPEVIKVLKINEWNKTIDLELLKEINHLFLECLAKHLKAKPYTRNKKIIETIKKSLKI